MYLELAPHADMLGFGMKTFRPQIVRGFGVAFLGNVFGIELLETHEGLPLDRWPD